MGFPLILKTAQTFFEDEKSSMISGIKQKTVVGKNGKIEIQSSDLPEGTSIEVIVLVESQEEDETNYLLSTPANRAHLLQALESTKDSENLVVISPEEWNEKYRV